MTPARLARMIQHGVFDVPEIKLPMGSKSDATSIRLHLLQHDRLEPEGYHVSGAFRSKTEGQSWSSSRSTPPASPEPKQPTGRLQENGGSSPPMRPQLFRGPFHLSTAALLKSVSLPYRPASNMAPHVLGSEKLPSAIEKTAFADESPPPYEFANPGEARPS